MGAQSSGRASGYTRVRMLAPVVVVVGGALALLSLTAAVISGVFLLRAAFDGGGAGTPLLIAAGIAVFAVGAGVIVLRGALANARLAPCPEPPPGTAVRVEVRPVMRGTAAVTALLAGGALVGAVAWGLSPAVWWPPGSAPGLSQEQYAEYLEHLNAQQRATEHLPPEVRAPRVGESAPPLPEPSSAAERAVHTGEQWAVLSGLLAFSAFYAVLALWLVTNRRRRFLWLSNAGLGYLPSRPGDDGYLPWAAVAELHYAKARFRGATLHHRWTVVPEHGPSSSFTMWPGMVPDADRVFEVLGEVAPDVATDR